MSWWNPRSWFDERKPPEVLPPTRARKVALLNVKDYPRTLYSAFWSIEVDGDEQAGYRWRAVICSYEPVAWEWQGQRTKQRPHAPEPVYPDDSIDIGEGPRRISQQEFLRMDPERQQLVMAAQEARRQRIAQIYEAHPRALHDCEEKAGVADTRDEADTAAQSWVMGAMPRYRKHPMPANSQAGHALALGPSAMVLEGLAVLFWRLFGPLLAIAYSTTIRNNRLIQVRDAIDGGSSGGFLRIYDGTRPATGGTATTLLAELTFSDPMAGAPSGGVLTASAITSDSSANATGTATWFRCVDSTGTFCIDGNVATSGSDLNIDNTSINAGQQVACSQFQLTAGNP